MNNDFSKFLSKFLFKREVDYRITWDKRVLVQNIFYLNLDCDIEGLKYIISEFLNAIENDDLKMKTQFQRAIYVKVHIQITVSCPLLETEVRDYYFSTVSYLINDINDFKEKLKWVISELNEQIDKLEESILIESGCVIENIKLIHINISEWVNRYMIAKRFGIDPKSIEIFESEKIIGFRHSKTKRFIYAIRKEKKKIAYVRIGKIKRKKKISKKKSSQKRVSRKKKKRR